MSDGFPYDIHEQDLNLGADYTEQRRRAEEREAKTKRSATTKGQRKQPGGQSMARKPRIITETVERLRAIARKVAVRQVEVGTLEKDLLDIAAKLDTYDARETRLDPSKRRKAKRKATR